MAISTSGYNTQRITSLYSGMDTESLVTNALSGHQLKVDSAYRDQIKAQWKLEAYTDINTKVAAFKSSYLDILSSTSVLSSSAYNKYAVSTTGGSSVAVSATSSATGASFSVMAATMAKAASISVMGNVRGAANVSALSANTVSNFGIELEGSAITSATTVAELTTRFGLGDDEDLSFSINGETFTFEQTATVGDIMDAVNNSDTANVTMSLDSAGKFSLVSGATGITSAITTTNITGKFFSIADDTGIGIKEGTTSVGIKRSDSIAEALRKQGTDPSTYTDGKMTVSVNGTSFTFDIYSDTISNMMTKINEDSTLGATFSYSELTDTFDVTSSNTGADQTITLTGFEGLLGTDAATSATGSDATITIKDSNGEYTLTQSSNTFTLDGIKFEINNAFDASVNTDEEIKVGVKRDVSSTLDLVKKFVEDYNSLVETINTLYNERADSDYQPLTEEEEEAVTESQAEKLTEKAKAGILGNDSTLGSLLSGLRSTLTVKVGDTGYSAMDLGLSTVAWDSTNWKANQGKLELDEERFTEMLEQNPGVVQKVLSGVELAEDGNLDTSVTRSADGLTSTSGSGLFTRMNAFANKFTSTMRTVLTDSAEDVTDLAEKLDDLTDKMNDYEETLWSKYSAMETLLSKLQSQSDALSSLIGS